MRETSNLHGLEAATTKPIQTQEIAIEGMTCPKCVETLEKALRKVKGVHEVAANLEQKRAVVTFDTRETDIPELHDCILKSGYTPAVRAD